MGSGVDTVDGTARSLGSALEEVNYESEAYSQKNRRSESSDKEYPHRNSLLASDQQWDCESTDETNNPKN